MTVLTHALVVNRTTVVAHLAIANALAAGRNWNAAERFYLSTLFFQPGFRPAEAALVVVQCRKIEENDRQRKKRAKRKSSSSSSAREEKEDNNRGVRSGSGKATSGGGGGGGGDRKRSKGDAEKVAKRK